MMNFREEWPFKMLEVGESCTIPPNKVKKARAYVHVYAGGCNKRMSWKTNWDGTGTVTRLPDTAGISLTLTAEEGDTLATLFPDKTRLKAFCKLMAGKTRATRLPDGQILIESR
jgi:hypothetical protein